MRARGFSTLLLVVLILVGSFISCATTVAPDMVIESEKNNDLQVVPETHEMSVELVFPRPYGRVQGLPVIAVYSPEGELSLRVFGTLDTDYEKIEQYFLEELKKYYLKGSQPFGETGLYLAHGAGCISWKISELIAPDETRNIFCYTKPYVQVKVTDWLIELSGPAGCPDRK